MAAVPSVLRIACLGFLVLPRHLARICQQGKLSYVARSLAALNGFVIRAVRERRGQCSFLR
jgi:hypothetical protein